MEAYFGRENLIKFLASLATLVEKLNTQLKTELTDLDDYEEVKQLLRGWKQRSSEEIQSLYSGFNLLDPKQTKPTYEVFISKVADELGKQEDVKEKLTQIGEALVDLKELIKNKIKDEISIYNVAN